MNGVIETATGDLLRAGFCDFLNDGSFDAVTESYRTDVPEPAKIRYASGLANMHRWDGAAWVEVAQPAEPAPTIAGQIARQVKTDADVSVTSTTWALIAGTSKTITLQASQKILVAVLAYGKAAVGQSLDLTVFVDGSNLDGAGGLGGTESDKIGNIGLTSVTGFLAKGDHTFDIRTKVSGGTGTVLATQATKPLALSLLVLAGDVP